jgi:ubiquinone biosynthesis protein
MFGSAQLQALLLTIPPSQLENVIGAFAEDTSSDERAAAVAEVLRTSGDTWRAEVGSWVADLLCVEQLVPEAFAHWRPLVHDAMAFVASHISDARLAPKIVEQAELPPDTPAEVRLGLVIAKTPGLQKLGQVLARTRRLSPSLRHELQKLENGICDVAVPEIHAIVVHELGPSAAAYHVELASELLSEASVSAILEFTWLNPGSGKRERGVFKVMKPHVPHCYAEDLRLLRDLAGYLGSNSTRYSFASREVVDTLEEVRLLLEREVDFRREQATLAEVRRVYRRPGAHAPKCIPELSSDIVTAMSLERGAKVTAACRSNPFLRRRIAARIVEALIADPIFSPEEDAVFHADPHAGNLLYNEMTNELVVLDWALTGRLSRDERRQVARLIVMMTFRDVAGVRSAITALSRGAPGTWRTNIDMIDRCVDAYFSSLPHACSLGPLDAMRLLDAIGLEGVRFPGSLVLIRKVLFTLDGVLRDVAGDEIRMDAIIARDFVARWFRQFGSLPAPFGFTDYLAMQRSAFRYVTGLWAWPAS